MKKAVINIQGKQYLVSEGDEILVDRLGEAEKTPQASVLLFEDDKNFEVGKPVLEKAKVELVKGDDLKGEKIRVLKFKAKSRYKKTRGYRHSYSKVTVKSIKL